MLTPALASLGTTPAAFNSGLTQPLFTELANLPQNTRCASEQLGTAEFRNNRHESVAVRVGVAHEFDGILETNSVNDKC